MRMVIGNETTIGAVSTRKALVIVDLLSMRMVIGNEMKMRLPP